MPAFCFSRVLRFSAPYNVLKICHFKAFQISKSGTFTRHICSRKSTSIHGENVFQLWPGMQRRQVLPYSTSTQEKIRDSEEVLVYVGSLQNRIKWVKVLSLGSSMIAFAAQPFVLYDLLKVNLGLCVIVGVVSSVFLSTPFILNYITKRYVIELRFNPGTKVFTAKTLNIVNQITVIQFTADDVIVPDIPGMLSSFTVKKIPLFVDANTVEDPDAYSHMMGYDKPLDLLIRDITDKGAEKESNKQ